MEELKPCPFCGAATYIKPINGNYTVECANKCYGTRIFSDKNKAAEAWNRRVDDD